LDDKGLAALLHGHRGVLVVGFENEVENFQKNHPDISLEAISHSGKWTLYSKNSRGGGPENGGPL